ncbi:MAG: outer membrane lipoprotein-sorting protein [Deltaproteobacteria bacterium]|nr:outer membrane lipoprotein-sorting protein [Deltaproteobacteria bacterium]
MKKPTIILIMFLFSISPALAQSGREIMEKVDDVARAASESSFSIMKLSTCMFGKKGNKIRCAEKPRIKRIESVQINTGMDKKDVKSVSVVLEPAAERGIGMLSFTYNDAKRDTESWLYLSALGKVKRMASGNEEDAEPVSVFGSEFTTEDMETGKYEDYNYKILKETKIGKRPAWKIEIIAKPHKKTRYSKTQVWVDQERFLLLKSQTYDKLGQPYKRLSFYRVEQIKGVWMARSIVIMNLQTNRLSKINMEKIALNVKVSPTFLTQRTLTDLAFREKHLKQLRQQMK